MLGVDCRLTATIVLVMRNSSMHIDGSSKKTGRSKKTLIEVVYKSEKVQPI